MLTMKQAASQAGVSKSTISRAVKKGRISAVKDDLGVFHIEPVELFRIYPPRTSIEPMEQPAPANEAVLNAEIAGLKAQLGLMRETLDDAKEERLAWQKHAQQQLLSAPSQRKFWTPW